MKPCSNRIPDCKILEFKENQQRKNIFDLTTTGVNFNKFRYFRIETPRQPYLINQGAKYVCESWENGNKTLHTGLIETGVKGYYFGDYADVTNGAKKNSLMLFHYDQEIETIRIYFFNRYSKRSISMKYKFCRYYIENVIVKNKGGQ